MGWREWIGAFLGAVLFLLVLGAFLAATAEPG